MNKLTLDEISQLHQSGQLMEAKQGYLRLLEDDPNDAIIHNQLGLLYAEIGELDAAQEQIEKAIALKPKDTSFTLHLANILKAKGLFGQAVLVLSELIKTHPHYAHAYNNLGTVYYAQAKLAEAIDAFHKAIDCAADYTDAYYNLGLALTKANKLEEAINAYSALIELLPQHAGARFQLGCLFMKEARYPLAIEQFNAILHEHPFHFETESNIASCYLKLGFLNEAKMHYLKAHALLPHDTQILFNLGVISMQQGFPKEAIEYYLRVLNIDAEHFDTHNNIGIVYLGLQNKEAALTHFRAALRLSPKNRGLLYLVNVIQQNQDIGRPPLEYVEKLFNAYADHYDAHLTQSLQYRVPEKLLEVVQEAGKSAGLLSLPLATWDILDLGCGTGLTGVIFKPYAKTLTGVDIASEMLTKAAEKNIYDQLVQADILEFLLSAASNQQYDLILAADVFVYFGDLTQLLEAVSQALKPLGLLAFNIEVNVNETPPFQLTTTGRFAHSKQYIKECARLNHLEMLQAQFAFMRKQAGEDMHGMYYVFKRRD